MVPAVGEVPAFKVTLRKEDPVAPDEVPLAQGTPLFVVADTHGQFETLVELLQKHRVIDVELKMSTRLYVTLVSTQSSSATRAFPP